MKIFQKYKVDLWVTCYFLFICNDGLFYPWYTMVLANYLIFCSPSICHCRQMEFNADAIAAHVVGSRVSAESLLRLSLSEMAFSKPLNFFYAHNKTFIIRIIYMQINITNGFLC